MAESILQPRTDYIVENGTSGNWRWHKWNSGIIEAWYFNNAGLAYGGVNSQMVMPHTPSKVLCLQVGGVLSGAATTPVTNVWTGQNRIYFTIGTGSSGTISVLSAYVVYTL